MYPPHSQGGYELVWQSAVRHLRGSGHAVRVLTTGHRERMAKHEEDDDVHRELGWYWRDDEFPSLGLAARLRLERRNARILEAHLDDFRPDLVCWWAMGGMSLSLIERVRRAGVLAASVVCDDWLLYAPKVDAWIRPLRARPRLGRVLGRLTGIPPGVTSDSLGPCLFPSETTRRRALQSGFRITSATVCHQGVPRIFRASPRPPWRWRFVYVGRIDPRKGPDLAILSLKHLPDDATLRIVGSGDAEYLESLQRLVHSERLSDRVSFSWLPRADLPPVYAEADAVIFPVRWQEPWGLVPLEAMAVGAPVVATGKGGSGEYLVDGENCLLFDPDEGAPALAAGLTRLAHDEELRNRVHRAGLRTAATFGEDDFNRAVERLIDGAATGATP